MGTAAGLLPGAVLRVWGPLQVYTQRDKGQGIRRDPELHRLHSHPQSPLTLVPFLSLLLFV